ncbi:MAG: methyltransferase, partial [Pseudomonadota bacterium]
IVMAIGFGLNISAVWALGPNRTYYGVELDRMPTGRIHAFPYSLISHPMLIGNMLAYGALLLDSDFRNDWWPLAIIHVTLNLTIILMEAYGGESRFHGILWSCIGLTSASLFMLIYFTNVWHFAVAAALINLLFGGVLVRRYAGRRAA